MKIGSEQQIPLDERSRLKIQIDNAKKNTRMTEDKMKKQLEQTKMDMRKELKQLEEQNKELIDGQSKEKRKMHEDITTSLKMEKEKTDLFAKWAQAELETVQRKNDAELDKQKRIYEEQNKILESQLQQQIQMN